MKLCYVCNLFVDADHDCPKAKEMAEHREEREKNGTDNPVFWLAMAARPTRVMVP